MTSHTARIDICMGDVSSKFQSKCQANEGGTDTQGAGPQNTSWGIGGKNTK
jgi:hypothetical protein